MKLQVSNTEQALAARKESTYSGLELVPRIIRDAGTRAVESYLCFFAKLGSRHEGYVFRSETKQFLRWSEDADLSLGEVRSGHVETFFSSSRWQRSTTRLYFGLCKKLFAHLESDRIIERSPFAGTSPSGLPYSELPPRTLEGLKQFLRDLDGYNENSPSFRPGLVAM